MQCKKLVYSLIIILVLGATVIARVEAALIHDAAKDGNWTEIQKELARGTNVDAIDEHGCTAIMYASARGCTEIVEKLITLYGANIHHIDNDGFTTLMRAVCGNRVSIVNVLLARGASVHHVDNDGDTALILAGFFGVQTSIVEKLIAHYANVNHANNRGLTALMVASNMGKKEVAKIFLARGADVYATNGNGETAMECARKNNQSKIVELITNHIRFSGTKRAIREE